MPSASSDDSVDADVLISLEFAHTNLAAIDRREIIRSAEAARVLVDHLRSLGHDVRTVVLFDDKKVERDEAEMTSELLLRMLADLDSSPDSWWFERELKEHLPTLCDLLPEPIGRRLAKSAHRRLRKYFSLLCSVDIALWHALRLGVIADPRVQPAEVVVSVLADVNQEWEDTARRDYLDHLPGEVSSRVISLYYPESASAPFEPATLTSQLDYTLKETSPCPSPAS